MLPQWTQAPDTPNPRNRGPGPRELGTQLFTRGGRMSSETQKNNTEGKDHYGRTKVKTIMGVPSCEFSLKTMGFHQFVFLGPRP